ncbi:hypothetical protein Tco_1367829, partial [Tanacetum coccineum]
MADVKLARRVSMSSPTDSICSGSGGTAVGGGDGDTDDCLMVKAIWISYEVRMVKVMVVVNMPSGIEVSFPGRRAKAGLVGRGQSLLESSRRPYKVGVRSGDGGADLTGMLVISSSELDMMTNEVNTLARGVVARKGVRR